MLPSRKERMITFHCVLPELYSARTGWLLHPVQVLCVSLSFWNSPTLPPSGHLHPSKSPFFFFFFCQPILLAPGRGSPSDTMVTLPAWDPSGVCEVSLRSWVSFLDLKVCGFQREGEAITTWGWLIFERFAFIMDKSVQGVCMYRSVLHLLRKEKRSVTYFLFFWDFSLFLT